MKTENKYSQQRPNLTVIDGGKTGLTFRRQQMSSVNSIGRKPEILSASSVEPARPLRNSASAEGAASSREAKAPVRTESDVDSLIGNLRAAIKDPGNRQQAMAAFNLDPSRVEELTAD